MVSRYFSVRLELSGGNRNSTPFLFGAACTVVLARRASTAVIECIETVEARGELQND